MTITNHNYFLQEGERHAPIRLACLLVTTNSVEGRRAQIQQVTSALDKAHNCTACFMAPPVSSLTTMKIVCGICLSWHPLIGRLRPIRKKYKNKIQWIRGHVD